MIKGVIRMLSQKYTWAKELFPILAKGVRSSRDLELRQDNRSAIDAKDIMVFCTMKNEGHRLPFFLDYYRNLGVGHFIFVDNGSTDDTAALLADQHDVTVFYTEASYKASNFGMHWLNYLLFRYGRGHWCLTCDPDEFLVYPYMDHRDLKDLTDYLSSLKEDAFFSVMVDMYSKAPVEDAVYTSGQDPLEVCPYFDKVGYSKIHYKRYRNQFIQGGVRRRVFSKDNPRGAPALNKVPLVKWKWNYAYIESMHMAIPRRLNNTCYITKTSGALLHYKFISQLKDKVEEELVAKQHFNDSAEYKMYDGVIKEKTALYDESVSQRFDSWKDLAKLGLINTGEW